MDVKSEIVCKKFGVFITYKSDFFKKQFMTNMEVLQAAELVLCLAVEP